MSNDTLVDFNGTWWAVLVGDVTDEPTLREAASAICIGDEAASLVREVQHLRLQTRVKNCGDYGDPCDMEGEWHAHWHGVRPGLMTAHTLVRFETKP